MPTKFQELCYSKLKLIPRGKVTTYKDLAKAINSKAYRAIGSAMNKNPYAPKVPCHRVINTQGFVGKYAFGTERKIKLLREEGIEIKNNKIDLEKYGFIFK